ncbi:hypothetical protein GQX73_g9408 [Xylaria multiplex]|uniref:Iron-sulfur assembly protein 1 n=1 Tax=Xylaria multiplex TaxID=323545 RepID=A0A7C8IMJ2_9PEZI|nr:hypothetical protein GQX73_g9408 [Xylaria multiplex]
MNSPRMALQRAPGALLNCLNAATTTYAGSCLYITRRFSQTQSWATPEKYQTSTPFQSYPLPSRPVSSPRNESIPETPIANPVPIVHETRPPTQPKTAPLLDTTLEQEAQKPKPIPPKRKLRPRKAALKLTPRAVEQLRQLLDQPEPKLIKVGVRNRGCSGLAYHLEYVDKPAAFDEEVEQDGVKVVIDSKALFSIIGSEMDWIEDKLNQRFIFRNPNIKEECGCGESFMV